MPDSNGLGFIEQAIGKILAAHTGVAALVGDKIYAPIAPQSAGWPCVVFRAVAPTVRDELLNAPGSSGLVRTRIRIFSAASSCPMLLRFLRNRRTNCSAAFLGTLVVSR